MGDDHVTEIGSEVYKFCLLKAIHEKNEELLKQTGEKFNIFSILNMERLEVRSHSAF